MKGALVLTNLWLKQNRKNKAMVGNEMLSLGRLKFGKVNIRQNEYFREKLR